MTQPFPGAYVPAVSLQTGFLTTPWILYFQQFSTQPGAVVIVPLAASPASFTASGPGSVVVAGGTVSAITLTRGGSATVLGITSGAIPVVNNDVVTIAYAVAPTVNFIPG